MFRRGSRHGRGRDDAGRDGQRAPVASAHREHLEGRMDLLRMAIELEGPCDFGDRPGSDDEHRAAFVAHFGELEAQLEEWNTCVERVRAAPAALWSWYERAARKRGVSEPPFALGALIDRLAILTAERSRHGQLDEPHTLQVDHFRDRVSGGERLTLHVEGQNVAQLPSEPASSVEQRTAAAEALLQKLFDDAQRSNQAAEIVSAVDALLDLKQPLLDGLAMHASVDAILFAPDCPECRRAEREQARIQSEGAAAGPHQSDGSPAGRPRDADGDA